MSIPCDVRISSIEYWLTESGRIAGEGGKVKFSIENASRTRIVLADT
jgi:RNA-binding protein PNO1